MLPEEELTPLRKQELEESKLALEALKIKSPHDIPSKKARFSPTKKEKKIEEVVKEK